MINLDYPNKQYIAMINRVQDYIQDNLEESITLDDISKVALFSKYHLQRIYSMMTSETLYSYIKRLRLEKAAYMLRYAKGKSIQDIALLTGFSNQSSFAKAFKLKYGISASGYKMISEKEHINIMEQSTNGKVYKKDMEYTEPIDISIKNEQDTSVIYLRHQGMYKGDDSLFMKLFTKLYNYCSEKKLMKVNSRWYVIYHDFGELSPEDMLRLSVCMSIEEQIAVSDEFGIMTIAGGQYSVGRFKVTKDDYQKAWNYMYGVWIPSSGYIPEDRVCFEHYPIQEGCKDGEQIVEIYIPVTPR